VGFVDDVHFTPTLHWGEIHFFAYVPDFVYASVAGSIQLDDVHEAAFIELHAVDTGIAGVAVSEVQAVDRLGDNPGRGGLAREK